MASYVPYLHNDELLLYGVSDATPPQILSATRLVNNYIGKPEGLMWRPDANGMPAFMASLSPTRSYNAPSIAPGSNVTVTVPNAQFGTQHIGDVVVIDRLTPTATEACLITAASGNTLTLASVQFAHTAPTIEFGLTLKEERPIPKGMPVVFASRRPIAHVFSMFVRAGIPKLPRQISDSPYAYDSLVFSSLNLGLWTQVDLANVDINAEIGAIQVYPSYLPLSYPMLSRISYVAGWSDQSLPVDIKQAVANIIRSVIDVELPSNIKLAKSGDATLESFSPSIIDPDTKALLQPYRAMRI